MVNDTTGMQSSKIQNEEDSLDKQHGIFNK